tara:strand:- start:8328 stop:9947 length:1620 start_codon:yes stop_codon:yes gene_type:complete
MVDFTIVLPINSKQTNYLQEKLLDISNPKSNNWRNYMSIEEIRNLSTPSELIRKPILNWLSYYDIDCLDFGDSIRCNSSTYTAANMWNIKLSPKTGKLSGNINIPKELQNNILFVEGLFQKKYVRNKTNVKVKSYNTIIPDRGTIGLEVMKRLYNFTTSSVSASVAAIEYQGSSGFSQDDLNRNDHLNMLSNNTIKHIVGNDTFVDTETQLDLQMEALIASNASVWFWDDSDWLLSFATTFFNTKDVPDVISMSWGWAEDSQCNITSCGNLTSKMYVDRVNIEYVKIGLRGISILVASGDAGAPGRTSENCDKQRPVNPVMPGSSPWVTSVSATFVNSSNKVIQWNSTICHENTCPSGTDEFPTNFKWTQWTTGGGFSIYNDVPEWQSNHSNKYLNSNIPLPSNFNRNGRGYPDISMIGHNCPVINGGNLEMVDGTSCSSPIAASVIAILNSIEKSKGKKSLGFLNPLLYKMHSDDSSIFNDVTFGNNYCTEYNCCPLRKDGGSDFGFLSSRGWDPVTGLGTMNVGKMIEYLTLINYHN